MVQLSTEQPVDSWGHLLAGLNFAAYRFWCHLSWPLSCRLRWTCPFSWHLTVARSTKQSCSCCFPDMMKTVMAKWRWTRDEGDGTCFTNYLQQSMYSKPVVFICVNALAGNIQEGFWYWNAEPPTNWQVREFCRLISSVDEAFSAISAMKMFEAAETYFALERDPQSRAGHCRWSE